MKDCVFCKIVKGEVPCFKIYEDQNFLAFLDIAFFAKGHIELVPKNHYRWLWEMPNIGQFFEVAKKIAIHLQKVTKDDWVAGIIWGMLVDHAHLQILPGPRKIDLTWPRTKLTKEKGEKLQKKLALES